MTAQFGTALECDVLKCGHHGSSTATTPEFLAATDPTWALMAEKTIPTDIRMRK